MRFLIRRGHNEVCVYVCVLQTESCVWLYVHLLAPSNAANVSRWFARPLARSMPAAGKIRHLKRVSRLFITHKFHAERISYHSHALCEVRFSLLCHSRTWWNVYVLSSLLSVCMCAVHVSCTARLCAFTEPRQSSVISTQPCSIIPEWSHQTDWRGTFWLIDWLIERSSMHSFIHSFIHLFIHSFVGLLPQSYMIIIIEYKCALEISISVCPVHSICWRHCVERWRLTYVCTFTCTCSLTAAIHSESHVSSWRRFYAWLRYDCLTATLMHVVINSVVKFCP